MNLPKSAHCGLAALALCLGATGCTNFTGADGLEVEGDEVVASDDDGGPVTGSGAKNPAPTAPLTCAYSPGPYGVTEGMVLPTQSWEGYAAGEDAPRQFNVAELYDCEGSKGIHAIIFDTSQYG